MATRDRTATDDYEWFSKAMELMRVRAREFAPNVDTEVGARVLALVRADVGASVCAPLRTYVPSDSRFSLDFTRVGFWFSTRARVSTPASVCALHVMSVFVLACATE